MATDFTYNGNQVQISGPLRTTSSNQPLNAKYRVEAYRDIVNIPTPAIGELIYVVRDETRKSKPSLYIIESLKANSIGKENMVVNKVILLDKFLTEVDANRVHGKEVWCGSKEQYDALTSKNKDIAYIITGDVEKIGEPGPTGPTGPAGAVGPTGSAGVSTIIKDSLNDKNELEQYGSLIGDSYVINGSLWVYDGNGLEDETHFRGFYNIGNIQGPIGKEGKSAFEVWKSLEENKNKTMDDFLDYIRGPQGEIGPAGPIGPRGYMGEPGPTGPTGAVGVKGAIGPTGPTGAVGKKGDRGLAGPQENKDQQDQKDLQDQKVMLEIEVVLVL